MHAGVAFVLYLAVGSILIFMFLLVCVRVSVFIEDTCPIRFCLRRKQRKLRKTVIRRMLYPDEPESPRPAPPSDENITPDIICQPYIYRDAYSTGLTGLSLLANLPLSMGYINEGNPGDAVVTNPDHLRIGPRRLLDFSRIPTQNQSQQQRTNNEESSAPSDSLEEDNGNHEEESIAVEIVPPPDYSNVTNANLSRIDNDEIEDEDELPPPSYDECVRQARNSNNMKEFM